MLTLLILYNGSFNIKSLIWIKSASNTIWKIKIVHSTVSRFFSKPVDKINLHTDLQPVPVVYCCTSSFRDTRIDLNFFTNFVRTKKTCLQRCNRNIINFVKTSDLTCLGCSVSQLYVNIQSLLSNWNTTYIRQRKVLVQNEWNITYIHIFRIIERILCSIISNPWLRLTVFSVHTLNLGMPIK